MTKNWTDLPLKIFFFYFLIKNCNLLIPRPPQDVIVQARLQEKPSALKIEHPALQNMRSLNFFFYLCGTFLPSWIRIQYGSETLVKGGKDLTWAGHHEAGEWWPGGGDGAGLEHGRKGGGERKRERRIRWKKGREKKRERG